MSKTIIGLITAVAGSLLVTLGFSDNCSSEIITKLLPLIGSIPGLGVVYVDRLSKGDINFAGIRKG